MHSTVLTGDLLFMLGALMTERFDWRVLRPSTKNRLN